MHDIPEFTEIDEDAQPTLPTTAAWPPRQPKWERQLGPKLVIRSLDEGPNCLMIPAQLKTTDTMELATTEAMVDTGVTGDFINQDFVDWSNSPPRNCRNQSQSTMWTALQTKPAALTRWSMSL